jgi:hypothetical protein
MCDVWPPDLCVLVLSPVRHGIEPCRTRRVVPYISRPFSVGRSKPITLCCCISDLLFQFVRQPQRLLAEHADGHGRFLLTCLHALAPIIADPEPELDKDLLRPPVATCQVEVSPRIC